MRERHLNLAEVDGFDLHGNSCGSEE
jgi:hypothetical protein